MSTLTRPTPKRCLSQGAPRQLWYKTEIKDLTRSEPQESSLLAMNGDGPPQRLRKTRRCWANRHGLRASLGNAGHGPCTAFAAGCPFVERGALITLHSCGIGQVSEQRCCGNKSNNVRARVDSTGFGFGMTRHVSRSEAPWGCRRES
jgi:hypothetical protein